MAVYFYLMIKIRNIPPRTFETTHFFPGCAGNPFDKLLHSLERIEKIPFWIIFLFLTFLSVLGGLPVFLQTRTYPPIMGILLFFILLDWILIQLLPKTYRSFGPVKVVVLMLAIMRVPFAWLPWGWNLGFELAGTLLVIYGFYIEPFNLELHYEVFTTGKFITGQPLRLLHLGDLHLERTTRREKDILQKIRSLKPDLILFSGDVLNLSYLEDEQSQADALAFFKEISAPLGVYGVTGSPAVDSAGFFKRLAAETSLTWLDNQVAVLNTPQGKINLVGLTCSHNPDLDEKVLASLIERCDPANKAFNLLLHHSPDLAPNASRHPIDLQLSGHTHGGQIRMPLYGSLYNGSLYGKVFEAGRYLVNGMNLYITRGLGMEGAFAPRVRFLCHPELILWEID